MTSAFLLALVAAATVHDAQPTTFRVQTELVRIDVLVERNGRPVAGLAAADFIVEDNGVPQRITLLPSTEPVSVSTVLDVSGSMTAEKLNSAGAAVRARRRQTHKARDDRDLEGPREYRQRYIITFMPRGVARGDGWHRLVVKLRNRAGKIRARTGDWSR